MNQNGERLIELSEVSNMWTAMIFPHKQIHKGTEYSPDDRTWHQTDW